MIFSRHMIVAVAASLACTVSLAQVDEGIRKKAEETCGSCHGPGGAKPAMPETPKLAGQQYEYLIHSLKAFRDGTRESPLMGAMAKPLSDADIISLSRYYSSQSGLRTRY